MCIQLCNATANGLKMINANKELYKMFCLKQGTSIKICEIYNAILTKLITIASVLTDPNIMCYYISTSCRNSSVEYNNILANNQVPCDLCYFMMVKSIQIAEIWQTSASVFYEICKEDPACILHVSTLDVILLSVVNTLKIWNNINDICKYTIKCI